MEDVGLIFPLLQSGVLNGHILHERGGIRDGHLEPIVQQL